MLGTDLVAVVFGLASALCWGAGDFSGGLATKRSSVFGVLAVGHTAGLILLVIMALLWHEPWPAAAALGWGFVAGLAGALGLAALYRALAVGRMTMIAPVSAVITAALPTLFSIAVAGWPGGARLLGFGLALVGIWLVTASGPADGTRNGLGLAIVAGCAFGIFFILLDRAGEHAIWWPLAASRVTSAGLMLVLALFRRELPQAQPHLLGLILLSGALDVIGNAFFVLATQLGRLDVAAILSSLYPTSTVILAAVLLREHVLRLQFVGMLVVLVAIVLIAR